MATANAAAVARLPNGLELVQGPLTYNADGLATQHNADFLREPRFAAAYARGMDTIRSRRANLQVGWRVQTCCWAAQHGLHLDGDFVECGVFTGIYSRAIVDGDWPLQAPGPVIEKPFSAADVRLAVVQALKPD